MGEVLERSLGIDRLIAAQHAAVDTMRLLFEEVGLWGGPPTSRLWIRYLLCRSFQSSLPCRSAGVGPRWRVPPLVETVGSVRPVRGKTSTVTTGGGGGSLCWRGGNGLKQTPLVQLLGWHPH